MQIVFDMFPLIARVLIGGMFVWAGVQKIMNYGGLIASMEGLLPLPEVAIPLAIVIEVLAGLAVIVGYKMKWAAVILALFTLVASLIFHTNFADQIQMLLFTKNAGIFGGLLYMAAFGAGRFSVDNRTRFAPAPSL